jgi:hypothetical protein
MKKIALLLTLFLAAYTAKADGDFNINTGTGGIVYVKQNGTGTGSSWANAYPGLADVLLAAKTNTDIKEIWVAAGTYKPLHAANDDTPSANLRDKAFVLVEGVKIYGGFPANASDVAHTSISTRGHDPLLNATILNGDNAYHVVIGVNIAPESETILDGFTITGGNANGSSSILVNGQLVYRSSGGGILNYYSSPTLTNLTISENTANYGGGGISNSYGSPTFTNLTISGNTVNSGGGGGIYNYSSSPTFTNVIISGNTAINGSGGGILNGSSSPTFTNVTITGNVAPRGGGIANNSASPTLTNVIISGNTASSDIYGGGIYNYNYSSPTLTNLTDSGNTAINGSGGGKYNDYTSYPKLTNSIVWGNSASTENNIYNQNNNAPTYTNYSLVQGEDLTVAGTGNLNGTLPENNPLFASPALASAAPTTTGNYRLKIASPLIDKGNIDLYDGPDVDIDGNPRFSSANIDLGAYEFSGWIWTGLAGNSWTEPDSWNTGEVPDVTSSVYIPGNLNTYPVLTAADNATAKDIRFGPGAEIGRQDLLTYEKAFVQLDFSATGLARDRWHMLANPLQELYAGDFTFGGYPGMDMKLFQAEGNRTVWNRITGLGQSFSAGDGFIVWLTSDPIGKGEKGLILSKGILELPYFDNANVPANVHWTHTYNDADTKSTFKAWKEENGSIVENENTPETVVFRNNEAYRLAEREVTKSLDSGQDLFATAGNPYMSSIDFANLFNYDANKTLIGGSYQIWVGPGGALGGSYAGYNVFADASFGRVGVNLNRYIAPMQSFIVERHNAGAPATLAFDLATVGVNGVSPGLRSAAPQGDKLNIVASTAQAGIRTVIVSHQEGGESFGSADSRKLLDEINSNPEVYTLKSRANNEQVATAVNVLGEITGETLVPLAISTTYKGELSFTFTGMDTYNARISLLDTETNTETDLTDKEQYEYRFNYLPEQSGEKIVANENRFFIRLNKSLTGIEEIASEAVRIYAPYPGTLQVVSTHPLRQVRVYNLQGSVVYNTSAIQTNTQKVENLAAGVYIVKVVSGNTVTTEKVIVK